MLDRWFMQKLDATGRVAYIGGQVAFVAVLLFILFGLMDLSWPQARAPLLGFSLVFLLVWGWLCTTIWPKKQEAEVAEPSPSVRRPKKKRR